MDQLVELLKYLSAVLAVLAPAFKLLLGTRAEKTQQLEDRHRRMKTFFEEGGTERHALLIESSFAAAVGHAKLTAAEVPMILRQRTPTQFMATYVQVRDYIGPNEDGSTFVLKSLAAVPSLRRILVALGVLSYVALLGSAVWLLFYLAPKLALAQSWANSIAMLVAALVFAAVGAWCLVGASHLVWASKLQASQR
jgi:hypothetical protein